MRIVTVLYVNAHEQSHLAAVWAAGCFSMAVLLLARGVLTVTAVLLCAWAGLLC